MDVSLILMTSIIMWKSKGQKQLSFARLNRRLSAVEMAGRLVFVLAIYTALTELAFCEEVSDHTGTMFYVNMLLCMLSVWIVRKLGFAFIKFVSKSISANFTVIF